MSYNVQCRAPFNPTVGSYIDRTIGATLTGLRDPIVESILTWNKLNLHSPTILYTEHATHKERNSGNQAARYWIRKRRRAQPAGGSYYKLTARIGEIGMVKLGMLLAMWRATAAVNIICTGVAKQLSSLQGRASNNECESVSDSLGKELSMHLPKIKHPLLQHPIHPDTVKIASPFRRQSLEEQEDLPVRPTRRSFFRRLTTRWQSSASGEGVQLVKVPRREHRRYFARDYKGNYIGPRCHSIRRVLRATSCIAACILKSIVIALSPPLGRCPSLRPSSLSACARSIPYRARCIYDGTAAGGRLGIGSLLSPSLLRQVASIIEVAVEVVRIDRRLLRRGMTEEQLPLYVILQYVPCSPAFIGLALSLRRETSCAGIRPQNFVSSWKASAAFLDRARLDFHAVDGFQESLGNALSNERRWTGVFTQLIDGQHTVTYELSLRGGKVREHQTRAVAKDNAVRQVDGLKVALIVDDLPTLGTFRGSRRMLEEKRLKIVSGQDSRLLCNWQSSSSTSLPALSESVSSSLSSASSSKPSNAFPLASFSSFASSAEKKRKLMPFCTKYSAQACRCSRVIMSALLTSNKLRFFLSTSLT
ncbi:hypothetical protein KC351_g71 [Hortaea werneckii]|nr:hypothetical protein KC351_g71 [Hortaea werneckii]